ncbi:MAG: hypothetical protein HKL96_07270 [Phycisphaerales bacterium]|nr:hypothetical protein [Phycisphaerales bacterium]
MAATRRSNESSVAYGALLLPMVVLLGLLMRQSLLQREGGYEVGDRNSPAACRHIVFSLATAEAWAVHVQEPLPGWRNNISGNRIPKGWSLDRWEGGLGVKRYRLVPGGAKALFIWEHQLAGATGNTTYEVFAKVPGGYRDVGPIWFDSYRCTSPDARGRPRVVTEIHNSADDSTIVLYVLTRHGFKGIASRNLHLADGEINRDRRLVDRIFFDRPRGSWTDVVELFHLRATETGE